MIEGEGGKDEMVPKSMSVTIQQGDRGPPCISRSKLLH